MAERSRSFCSSSPSTVFCPAAACSLSNCWLTWINQSASTNFSSTNVWLRSSQSHATRSHRPKCLDSTISNCDIPVVDIDCRVALAGNDLKLLPQPQHIIRIVDYTPRVGTLNVLFVGPPSH